MPCIPEHTYLYCENANLSLLPLSLSDLGRETSLDGGNGTSGSTRVTCNEVQSVLSFVELCIGRFAGLAGDVFHCQSY